ncbi:MAG: ATP-binding cassette domain-containing protein [Crocinitomix sp.]|nr:ATP-binding cassette domain-containing protein [Crocinitomix sp.]
MASKVNATLKITNASTHNLKNVSLEIPHHQFIVVTGISGSGKSSLAFDIIAKEGQRRYFETLPSFARQFMGKISPANVDRIEGLSPVITVSQKTTGMNTRSTVGTLTDIYAWLRLLYARTGTSIRTTSTSRASVSVAQTEAPLTRSLFSFNSDEGKCLRCNGLGKEEEIDLKKLIVHPDKSIREGALAPTLPTGYIMYSQVTIDVLNEVCKAEGFDVDIPWNELTEAQQKVILYGSERLKVPFGKHSIESRLKWTGIKAKPREDGFYKGMIPIMSDILRRDRNANILKYVSAITCKECAGKRLNKLALSVLIHDRSIANLLELSLVKLLQWLATQKWNEVAKTIVEKITKQIDLLTQIGVGYLELNQPAKSLSGSEIQRIRVINQIGTELSNVLYVFDEPSIGLHPDENKTMLSILKTLVARGNTVIVVEHDLDTINSADWIIDIGPKAGIEGGNILFNGSYTDFLKQNKNETISPTFAALKNTRQNEAIINAHSENTVKSILLEGCNEGRLENGSYSFKLGCLNIVTGKSGSGKKDLVKRTLMPLIQNQFNEEQKPVAIAAFNQLDAIDRLVYADQAPIGRTPRSNPATYLGISDHIRDLFSKLPESKAKKLTKSSFSFNTKGGRCETCLGAGKTQIGMHFLGQVDLICGTCQGKRFNAASLAVQYKGKTISEVYALTVNAACTFFQENNKILKGLRTLQKIGLGYLTLGQSATTLSGGEAQRIKLANELQKKSTGKTLYILDEPSIGLHPFDLDNLLDLFTDITSDGNTIVCIEQDELILNHAAHIIELKPLLERQHYAPKVLDNKALVAQAIDAQKFIRLNGVTTHQLKNVNAVFPKNKLTAVTGISGSGKSSLVYDSLFAEANARFSESLSTYNRSLIQSQNRAEIEQASGLTPTIAIQRKRGNNSNRSTVATVTGIHDHLRLLYSRIAQLEGHEYTAQHFSFNHKLGACPQCKGHGIEKKCDPDILILDPEKTIFEGALNANKTAQYFTNPQGQFIATLKTIATQKKWNLLHPWQDLSAEIKNVILYGTGETAWQVNWAFKTKTRSGTQELNTKWLGFYHYINDEYERHRDNKNIQSVLELLHDVPCEICKGDRLQANLLDIKFAGKNMAELCKMSIKAAFTLLQIKQTNKAINAILKLVLPPVSQQMETIMALGLDYLTMDRMSGSLSGGEIQRIRLAGQLSANLFGVTYVLDEPTIGLDQDQVNVLIDLLRQLTKKGNTVVVIEHDKSFISASDYLIEMGPESGKNGGEIVYQGATSAIQNHPETITNKLLFEAVSFNRNESKSPASVFGVKGASKNNLKGIDVTFESSRITAVTGVSGSGKSSLIKDVIYASVTKKRAIGCDKIFGFEIFDAILLIDQNPIAINALSCPATIVGFLDLLQAEFAGIAKSEALPFKKADFSYQSKIGKCEACKGYGEIKTSMDFMSDIWVQCETCEGSRYNPEVNAVKFEGQNGILHSIGDLLQLSAAEVINLFQNEKLNLRLQQLIDLGIGHLQLGQGGNSLSGGEAQRLKLATALTNPKRKTLYLFDEPSNGLHQLDLLRLITIFDKLIEQGHAVVFIEHHPTLISIAHKQIRLGPGSGENGGKIM